MGLGQDRYEGLARFRYALRQFLAHSEALSLAEGMTPQQYQALLVIKTHAGGTMTVRELAAQMLLQPNGAVQLVDRLVTAGLAARERSVADRRSVFVVMTAKGRRRLKRLAARHISALLEQEPLLAESLQRLRQMKV